MEASLASLGHYFEYNNETKHSGPMDSEDTNVRELELFIEAPELEVLEGEERGLVADIEHSETGTYLSRTDELVNLLQKTKDISWQNSFQIRLEELRQIPDDWNGYGSAAPNYIAIESCKTILDILHEKNLQPSSIYPSAQEGVTITFAYDQRRGILECYNDGDIISFVFQGDNPAKIREIGSSLSELREELTRIEGFVHGR